MNWLTPDADVVSARTWYALQIPATAQPRRVCRVEFPSGTRFRTPAEVPIAILASDRSGRPGPAIGTGTATVLPARAIYHAAFDTPVTIAPGATTYVAIAGTAGDIFLPVSPSGLPTVVYDGGPGRWRGPATTVAWKVRWTCSRSPLDRGANLTTLARGCPNSTGTVARSVPRQRPVIGRLFEEGLFRAPSRRPAWWFVFGSPSPLDLAPFGAPGCRLQVAPVVGSTHSTDGLGEARASLPLPLDTNLIGRSLVSQWVIHDPPTNRLGFVVSDAHRIGIGNY